MQNKAFINSDGCVELRIAGDQTYETIKNLYEESKPLIAQLKSGGKPLLGLVDMTLEGSFTVGSNKAAMEILEGETYDRIAMFNAPVSEVAKLIIKAMGKDETTKVFDTRAEAKDWLKSSG